jgi:hypothetical protein
MVQTIKTYFVEYWTNEVEVRSADWRDDLAFASIRGSYSPSDFDVMDDTLRTQHGLTIYSIEAAGVGVFNLVIDRVDDCVENGD